MTKRNHKLRERFKSSLLQHKAQWEAGVPARLMHRYDIGDPMYGNQTSVFKQALQELGWTAAPGTKRASTQAWIPPPADEEKT